MKKHLLLLLLISCLSSEIVADDFGIGGLFSLNVRNSSNLGLSGALTMAFSSEKNPIVWDLLIGGFSQAPQNFIDFMMGTRVDFHLFDYTPNDRFSLFLGPGLGYYLGFLINGLADGVIIPGLLSMEGQFSSILVARLILGMKFFAKDSIELFLQVTPQIGWLYQENFYDDNLGIIGQPSTTVTTINDFYWSIDFAVGIRFWT